MGGKPRPRPPEANGCAVRRGDVYRIPRPGKPPVFVRIASVRLNRTRRGDQPKALYYRITRSGVRVGPKRIVASLKLDDKTQTLKKCYAQNLTPHWLVWRDGAWRLPETWELQQC